MPGNSIKTRYEELDSLRGLAALSVVLSHFFLVIPNFFLTTKLNQTPLHIFWAGHEAVILFFMLSGFVLALPFTTNKVLAYKSYLVKRICRIYLPYMVSIVIGGVCLVLLSPERIEGLTDWFNGIWMEYLDVKIILNHILFLGDYRNNSINFVIWSLIHEMRISIIFPLLMILVMRCNWKTTILLCIGFSLIYHVSEIILNLQGYSDKFHSSYHRTVHYAAMFILGALLAKNKQLLMDLWVKQKLSIKVLFFITGILSYTYSWWFLPNNPYAHLEIVNDWAIALGSFIFMVSSLCSNKVRSFLLIRSIHFLGQISYSLYLFHGIVLFSFIHTLYDSVSYWKVLVAAFIFSVLMATLSYYFIEKPSIKLGRKLTSRNEEMKKTTVA